jgi:hypothetical protein
MDNQSPASVEQNTLNYHIHEYDSLRAEILARQSERAQIENLGAAGIFAIYAWLCSEPSAILVRQLQLFSWWIPFLAALYCFLRIRNISIGIKAAGDYLVKLQSLIAAKELGGWETSLRKARESAVEGKLDLISKPMNQVWLLATLATFLTALAATVWA